jgi:hypothetical protein
MSETQGEPTGEPISASELRRLAETADGLRNRDLVLVRREGHVILINAADKVATDDHLVTLRTDDEIDPASRPAFDLELQIENGPSLSLRNTYDAAFWSESAIDKFVLPYYARYMSPARLRSLRERIASDPAMIMLPHPPMSILHVLRFTAGGIQDLSVDEYLAL